MTNLIIPLSISP